MISHKTIYRVIYGDTDNMGIAYYANYLRWFEMGRTELFRMLDLPYTKIEENDLFLPVLEVFCKYQNPLRYDDQVVVETALDLKVRAGMKFDYQLFNEDETKIIATGYTKHAFLNGAGRVVRPPEFLKQVIAEYKEKSN